MQYYKYSSNSVFALKDKSCVPWNEAEKYQPF